MSLFQYALVCLLYANIFPVDADYMYPVLTEEPQDGFGFEDQPLTLKCRATGNPPPVYTWFKDKKEMSIAGGAYQKTQDGDLIITKFNPVDDIGQYQCHVSVSDSNLKLTLVSRVANIRRTAFPKYFQTEAALTTGYAGGSIRMSVDASNFVPQPQIGWNYRGKPTIRNNDPRFFVLPQGVLHIYGLTSADDGEIRAIARSAASGTKTAQIHAGKFAKLTIAAASTRPASKGFSFLGKPQNIDLNWGRSTILEALADSANPVTYTWYKDDKPIQLGSTKSIVGKGNLKILYAKEEDAGTYKVVAKSGGQTLEASAKIEVLSPPQFTVIPPRRVYAKVDGKALFKFKVTGNPKPKVNWYHDGVIVDAAADYIEVGEDFLTVKDLIENDAGMYQARATNSMGDAQTSLELIIVQQGVTTPGPVPTTLPLLPGKTRNVQAYPKSDTEINISWQEPSIINGAITGYKLIYFSTFDTAQTLSIDGNLRFSTVKNLNPDTSYSFKIQAENANGFGPLSDNVVAKTMPSTAAPGVVQNIQSSISGTTLSVSWSPPSSGVLPTLYKIYYANVASSATPLDKETSGTSTMLYNLVPGSTYKFWIVPYASAVNGKKSDDTFVFVPLDSSTLKPNAVTNLQVTAATQTMANVQWDEPKGGPKVDKYIVYYRNIDDSSSSLMSSSTLTTTAIIQNLSPNTAYEFHVVPYSNGNEGPKSNVKVVTMLEEVPPAPINLSPVSVSSNTVKVRWQFIPYDSFNGKLLSYKLKYHEQGKKEQTSKTISDIPVNVDEWKIEGVKPETSYVFQIRGVSGGGNGKMSQPLTIKTRDITKQGPTKPVNFRAIHHADAPDVIMLNWDEPLLVTGRVNSYIVFYRPKGDPTWESRTTTGDAKSYNISEIVLGATYETYIVAVDDNGEGINTRTVRVPTLSEKLKPDPPRQLVITPKADSLTATWLPPLSTSDAVVRGYKVTITNVKVNKEIFEGSLPGRQNTDIQIYNGVESNTPYEVSVRSYNGYGTSTEVKTSTQTLISPTITIVNVQAKVYGVNFKWKDSIPTATGEYIVRYNVFDVNGISEMKTKSTQGPEIDVTGLTPYTSYRFFVKRKTDIAFPVIETLNTRTLEAVPSAPLDVTARGVSQYPTWLILSWQVPRYPNGKIREYVILYSADNDLAWNQWPNIKTKSVSMTHNVTGLTKGTLYYFVIYAVNGAGAGAKSAMYSTKTGGVGVPGGVLPSTGADGVIIVPAYLPHNHTIGGGLGIWWILLIIILLILLLLLLLLLIWCCCCKKKGGCAACCWPCCPCCKSCWYCCCLPFCLCCCPCCCTKRRKRKDEKMFITAPIITSEEKAKNGHAAMGAPPDLWMTSNKSNMEMMPLTANVESEVFATPPYSGSGLATLSRHTSKSSIANIKVPVPGDTTFISYKTSLQDYCQKVGWLAPIYQTNQTQSGCHSKVSFGGSAYGSGDEYGTSNQDAEQRSAHAALCGLGVLEAGNKYQADVNIAVPSPGDASFISYKCSLHDFCQQCNILPPRFSTSSHQNGYGSSVQVGSHTFNMPNRVESTQEAEQKVACISLQGLCMTDSQSGYHPESCFTVPGPGTPNFVSFKSSLHDFCQRYKLPPPQYITNQGTQGFSAKLKFGGLFFQSSDYFTTRLEAEQHAAFEALQGLGLLESSVQFGAALDSNLLAGPSGGVNLTHGSGMVTVGTMGGTLPSNYSSSRHGSRSGSRPPSRPGSRPPSRPSSRPGSRQGSQNHLNQYGTSSSLYSSSTSNSYSGAPGVSYGGASGVSYGGAPGVSYGGDASTFATGASNVYATPTSYRDAPTLGQRSHSSGSGFQGYNSAGLAATSGYSSNTGYNEGSHAATPIPMNGILPRTRSKSFDQNQEYNSGGVDGGASTFSYSMSYQHTTSSSMSSTLPRKAPPMLLPNSSYAQIVGKSATRGYGSAQNVSSDFVPSTNTRSASHPALTDLEMEMAGLEGLIKDLNGITTSGKVA